MLAGVTVLALLPQNVVRLPVCSFRALTGLPCPGCGLTRSMLATAHGDLSRAWTMHPIGILFFALLLAAATLAFLPRPARELIAARAETGARTINVAAVTIGAGLALYGVGRLIWVLGSRGPSIW